jgi:hypothetical protein
MNGEDQFTVDGPYAPLPVRWLNSFGRKTSPVFDWLVSLQKEDLLEAASRRTGLNDWGDPEFQKALAALVDSANQDGKLTFFGRFSLRQFLIGNLCSRLRTVEVLKRFPEIQQQKIHRPIFITGWYRTGTTHLHNLFALHPDLRAPLFWELRHPCPTLDPKTANPHKQIRSVRLDSKIHSYLAPDFNAIHSLEAEKPEECLHLFDKACAGTTSFFMTEARSFAWWLLDQDIQYGYDFYNIQLQLLNWLRPGRQWVLKWPFHLWHLDTLLKTFPDAAVIHLHRDPCQAIPSVCSLAAAARSPFCQRIDATALGEFWLDYGEAGLKRSLAVRKNNPATRICDIRYPDLKNNPIKVIKRIQDSIGLRESATWTNELNANLNSEDKKKRKQHHYNSTPFGLHADQIRERFSTYIDDYDLSA